MLLILGLVFVLSSQLRADNVTLPDVNTDAGLLARLFIAECRNPGYKDYDKAVAAKAMRAMHATVDNRLHNKPEKFGAPNAKSYADIVGAAGQFAGFSQDDKGKIVIAANVQKRIDEVMKIANTGKPGKYAEFVQLAIDSAKAKVDDPFKGITKVGGVPTIGGSYGWRTATAAGPGGDFVAIGDDQGGALAGNRFYTLKK
jgi:hypothetical protein